MKYAPPMAEGLKPSVVEVWSMALVRTETHPAVGGAALRRSASRRRSPGRRIRKHEPPAQQELERVSRRQADRSPDVSRGLGVPEPYEGKLVYVGSTQGMLPSARKLALDYKRTGECLLTSQIPCAGEGSIPPGANREAFPFRRLSASFRTDSQDDPCPGGLPIWRAARFGRRRALAGHALASVRRAPPIFFY